MKAWEVLVIFAASIVVWTVAVSMFPRDEHGLLAFFLVALTWAIGVTVALDV